MESKSHRTRHEIMRDICQITRGGAGKTAIVYQANLNFAILQRYLATMTEAGLIRPDDPQAPRPIFRTTEKGMNYIHSFMTCQNLAGDL